MPYKSSESYAYYLRAFKNIKKVLKSVKKSINKNAKPNLNLLKIKSCFNNFLLKKM